MGFAMTTIIDLLVFEEGFRAKPYLDSEGYPTVGTGFLLAKTKCTPAELKKYYDFTLPLPAAEAWLRCHLEDLVEQMAGDDRIRPAYKSCANSGALSAMRNPRTAVLISMAYQMGIEGLAKFTTTLGHVAAGRFTVAAGNMLQSKWAKQTPNRAKRHATQMATGIWCKEYP
jgi:lysozyme